MLNMDLLTRYVLICFGLHGILTTSKNIAAVFLVKSVKKQFEIDVLTKWKTKNFKFHAN